VDGLSGAEVRAVAAQVRSPAIRTLGFFLAEGAQVSCNLVEPELMGPAEAYDKVAAALPKTGRITRAELVGLVPRSVLDRIPAARRVELGLDSTDCLEARLVDPTLRKRRS
jgi:hypothetical protein